MASSHNSKSLQSCGSEDRPGGERENQRLTGRSPSPQAGMTGGLDRPGLGSELTLLVSLFLHLQHLLLHKAQQLRGVGHPQHERPQLYGHSLGSQGHLRDSLWVAGEGEKDLRSLPNPHRSVQTPGSGSNWGPRPILILGLEKLSGGEEQKPALSQEWSANPTPAQTPLQTPTPASL